MYVVFFVSSIRHPAVVVLDSSHSLLHTYIQTRKTLAVLNASVCEKWVFHKQDAASQAGEGKKIFRISMCNKISSYSSMAPTKYPQAQGVERTVPPPLLWPPPCPRVLLFPKENEKES